MRIAGYLGLAVCAAGGLNCANDVSGPQVGSDYFSVENLYSVKTLIMDDRAASDNLGRGMSADGNTLVLGAWAADDAGSNSGKAYIYTRNYVSWDLQATLVPPTIDSYDRFGEKSAIDGDTMAIAATGDGPALNGQQGSVYIYTRSGSTWTQQAKLASPVEEKYYRFGFSLALDGDTLLVGTTSHQSPEGAVYAGAVYVYVREGNTWSQQALLTLPDAQERDYFGDAVALDGDTAVVSASGRDTDEKIDSGTAFVFTRTGTTWTLASEIRPPDPSDYQLFGAYSMAMDGDTLIVGCYADDELFTNRGAAYVYRGAGASWSFEAKLIASDATQNHSFGRSVDLQGDNAVIGAPQGYSSTMGAAYLFTREGTTWTERKKLLPMSSWSYDYTGYHVALMNDVAVVTSPYALGYDEGQVSVFHIGNLDSPVRLGHSQFCSPDYPCGDGEGDCDDDSDCEPDTMCLYDAGLAFGYDDAEIDVCATRLCPSAGAGASNFCSADCPCDEGEGDCDGDDQCAAGLRCLHNVGTSYGYADSGLDVCTALCPAEAVGQSGFCTADCLCTAGQGDCDSDADCAEGLVCNANVGESYGYGASVDVCEVAASAAP